MNAHELLIAARALIEAPEKWTQGAIARNKFGDVRSASSPEATCFCAEGTLWRASNGNYDLFRGASDALSIAAYRKFGHNYVIANDDPSTTHADVLALFDRAIAATAPEVT